MLGFFIFLYGASRRVGATCATSPLPQTPPARLAQHRPSRKRRRRDSPNSLAPAALTARRVDTPPFCQPLPGAPRRGVPARSSREPGERGGNSLRGALQEGNRFLRGAQRGNPLAGSPGRRAAQGNGVQGRSRGTCRGRPKKSAKGRSRGKKVFPL